MRPTSSLAALAIVALAAALSAAALDPSPALAKDSKNAKDAKAAPAKPDDDKPFDTVTEGYERLPGLFALHRKAEDQKVLLEIQPSQLDQTFLFAGSVDQSAGERGFYASQQLADFAFTFRRVGKTIQWVQKNTAFTAQAGTPSARAVARSFPDAILGSAKILSKPHAERGSLIVDAAELFAARDLPGFAAGLSRAYAPSTFTFDKDKSGVREVKAFPENVLLRAQLHFTTDQQRSTSTTLADGRSVPILVAYSLSAVPATAYRPRLADDRVGHFLVVQQDFTSDQPKTPYRRWVTRWNLEKQDPAAAVSPPKQPIVFWLENTIPVEYRESVRQGALLWNAAFEKAGFKDAVVVKQQPDDADWDAADVRYNVIRWFAGVDATFAIGPSRANPFTGEIYDADIGVSEGIIRNARRLAEEYVAPTFNAHEAHEPAATAWSKDPRHLCGYASGLADQAAFATALLDARGGLSPELEERLVHEYIVELIAHEVGHTLGLRHNFRASALQPYAKLYAAAGETPEASQSSSVMDYNPVLVAAKGAKQGAFVPLTLGPYDYWAIEYAYKPFSEAEEAAGLAAIASRCADPALGYSTDEDAMGTYSPLSIDPLANQYDQATDPLEYFRGRMALVNELWTSAESRLAEPGEGYQILRRAVGRGMSDSYRSLMTSSKWIGGVHHRRDHVGDPNGRTPYEPVAAAKQREAMDLLSEHCFGPKAFRVSPDLLNRLAVERIYGLDPSYWNIQRLDYPWHDVVLNVQRSVLARLLHPVTLGRVLDNELRFAANEKPFKMADLFGGLNASIWSELDGGAAEISSLRRNLQREHLKQLVAITLREPMPAPSQPGQIATPPYPEDATTLSRWALGRIQSKIRTRLAAEGGMDVTTRAHLQDSQARIAAVLAAQVERPD
jgi:hypothetical protein